jgi:hypothetical protein
MPGYSLVPVDYQPDFDGYTLVPVDYDPFAADGVTQQAQLQQPPTTTQPAQPQPQTQPQQPATGAGQPGVNGPATGNSPQRIGWRRWRQALWRRRRWRLSEPQCGDRFPERGERMGCCS